MLNFGHTTAHALETITNYREFRHGEAVGYGMLVAGELSRNLGLIDAGDLQMLRDAVSLCGPLPRADNLDINQIIRALKHDKKSVGGQINWVLLEGIGRPRRSLKAGLSVRNPCVVRCELGLGRKRVSTNAMQRSGERGSANLKFVIVMAILGATPTPDISTCRCVQAKHYKDLMQHYVDVAVTQGYPPSWVGEQLMKSAR